MSLLGGREEHESVPTKAQQKAADTKVSRWKANVKRLLAQPLVDKGVSPRYITSGAVSIADDMLAGNCTSMSTLSSAPRCTHFIEIVHDMSWVEEGRSRERPRCLCKRKPEAKTASVKQEDGEFEEWGGISC